MKTLQPPKPKPKIWNQSKGGNGGYAGQTKSASTGAVASAPKLGQLAEITAQRKSRERAQMAAMKATQSAPSMGGSPAASSATGTPDAAQVAKGANTTATSAGAFSGYTTNGVMTGDDMNRYAQAMAAQNAREAYKNNSSTSAGVGSGGGGSGGRGGSAGGIGSVAGGTTFGGVRGVNGIAQSGTERVGILARQLNAGTDTVAGQLDTLLASDSPLMRQAQSAGLRQASSRGLLNSSMAGQASQAALLSTALPIASQDASAYLNQGMMNQDAANQANRLNAQIGTQNNQFNAGEQNRFGLLQRGTDEAIRQAQGLQPLELEQIDARANAQSRVNALQVENEIRRAQGLQPLELEQIDARADAGADAQARVNALQVQNEIRRAQGLQPLELERIDAGADAQSRLNREQVQNQIEVATGLQPLELERMGADQRNALERLVTDGNIRLQLQQSQNAGQVFNTQMAALGQLLSTPGLSPEQIRDGTNRLLNETQASLEFFAGAGAALGDGGGGGSGPRPAPRPTPTGPVRPPSGAPDIVLQRPELLESPGLGRSVIQSELDALNATRPNQSGFFRAGRNIFWDRENKERVDELNRTLAWFDDYLGESTPN